MIISKPVIIPKPTDNSRFINEINLLKIKNDSLSITINDLKSQRDTVIIYKDSIKKVYYETIKYIDNSNVSQIDSIIRANWD